MKACPFCAEEVQDAAVVCKHCRRDIALNATVPTPATSLTTSSAAAATVVETAPVPVNGNGRAVLSLAMAGVGFIIAIVSSTNAGLSFFLMWIGIGIGLPGSRIVRWGGGFIAALLLIAVGLGMGGNRLGKGSSPRTASVASSTPRSALAPESGLTSAQRNAARSAKSYLAMSGFSRQGLIDQLSSEYGDQFSVGDATAAVDSINVDWNAQAVRSAAAYIKMSGFSCNGLIDQLSSPHGDKYTVEQATYGTTQAGIC